MEQRQLSLLRELDERGSVAAVAEALLVTPSAVSQQLGALQRELPVPLTERRSRRLVLTEAGRALAAAAVRVEESFAAARAAVDDFLDDPEGEVRVSAFHSAGLAWFPELLADGGAGLRLADEDVAFEDFPVLALRHDIVIAHRLPQSPPWPDARVVVTPLLDEPIAVAVAADHPLAGRGTVAAADLSGERWVAVHEGFPLTGLLDAVATASGGPLDLAHRVNEFFVAAGIVRTGAAVALMPRVTMQGASLDGIALLAVEGLPLHRAIDALVRPEAMHRRAVRDVLRRLRRIADREVGFIPTERTADP